MLSIQECLDKIDQLEQFSGTEQEATSRVDSILLDITNLENQTHLDRLNSEIPDDAEFERRKDQLNILNRRLRSAQIACRERRTKTWFKRRELFSGRTTHAGSSHAAKIDAVESVGAAEPEEMNPTLTVAEEVTASLHRIHQLAQAEVLRSEINIDELDTSSRALNKVSTQYSGLDLMLNGSKRLVRILDEADTRDRRHMQLALSFLGAVLVWIVYRRLLKLPIKILLWSIARFLGIMSWIIPSKAEIQESETVAQHMAQTLLSTTVNLGAQTQEAPVVSSHVAESAESIISAVSTHISESIHTVAAPLESGFDHMDL